MRPEVLVRLGIPNGQRLADGLELRSGLLDTDAFIESADGEVPTSLTRLTSNRLGHRACGQPDIGVEREVHARGHDADDRSIPIDDPNVPADDVRVGAVALSPEGVADQDD